MKFFSPAKINLFLKILNRRSDGFHNLLTWCRTLCLGDELSVVQSYKDVLISNVQELNDKDNLVWRATQQFREYTGITSCVSWILLKKIPLRAGLGGGSSNAATALFALNRLFQTRLSNVVLAQLGARVGMDVPFFFSKGSAFAYQRGERCIEYPLQDRDDRYVLYFSDQGVMTQQAFAYLTVADMEGSVPVFFENDLEKAVFRFRKDLLDKKTYLKRIWSPFKAQVMMTGSGSTIFVRYQKSKLSSKLNAQAQYLIRASRGLEVTTINRNFEWYTNPNVGKQKAIVTYDKVTLPE